MLLMLLALLQLARVLALMPVAAAAASAAAVLRMEAAPEAMLLELVQTVEADPVQAGLAAVGLVRAQLHASAGPVCTAMELAALKLPGLEVQVLAQLLPTAETCDASRKCIRD